MFYNLEHSRALNCGISFWSVRNPHDMSPAYTTRYTARGSPGATTTLKKEAFFYRLRP